jgi:hypothetical protein
MDITKKESRANLAELIKSTENEQRKANSLKQTEIFSDRLYQYVIEELRRHFSAETVQEMPIVSFINFPRRIVKNTSSVYKSEPTRAFVGVSDDQAEKLALIYQDAEADNKMKRANEFFNLQDQTHLMIVPKNGKLVFRNLTSHQIDAIPSRIDPEVADAYILSAFDKQRFLTYQNQKTATGFTGKSTTGNGMSNQGGNNTKIADINDYKALCEIYTYWDKQYNFIFNGKGELLDPATLEPFDRPIDENDILSPIPGTLPFVDISQNKDNEYFVRPGNCVTDFGIQYNAATSDVWHISRMQGYSVGVLKGPEELMPETLKLGPNYLLRLKTSNAEGVFANGNDISFDYVSPSPDIEASLKLLETMLVNFISSRGIDPKEIAQEGSKSYNSALERLLAMIDKFEASKDDFKLFRKKEKEIFQIIKAWINSGTEELDAKYRMPVLSDNAEMNIEFAQPEMVMTKQEKATYWQSRRDARTASRIDQIMDEYNVDREGALVIAAQIDEDEGIVIERANDNQE